MTDPPQGHRLALLALILAIALVLTRATMVESLRDTTVIAPNSPATAHLPGAAVGLVLDALSCVPALLVLIDRLRQRIPVRRKSLACGLFGLLAIWTLASVIWADDKFAAAVGAADIAAAAAVFWTASQLVINWTRLRFVAVIIHGLLTVYVVQGLYYRYSEWPATVATFEKNKLDFLNEQGWKPGGFMADQFEKKVLSGEMVFFNQSVNSFAAALVLLAGVTAGLAIDRVAYRKRGFAAVIAIVLPVGGWILHFTQCKAAYVTPVLIAAILIIVWRWQSKLTYARGLVAAVLGMVGLVAYGLFRGGLPGASLNFRWRYWVGSWRLFLSAPWVGVGWNNFGAHYLHYRLAIASEEIQDPHNFVVRWMTELGIIGAALGCAWLARMWWELTRPSPALGSYHRVGLGAITLSGGLMLVICSLAAIDFTQSSSYVVVELGKRALYFCVLVVGAGVAAMKSSKESDLDDRPALWLEAAILASLAAFLVHNLIEFSFIEPGPLMLFALLAGSALGVRRPAAPASAPMAAMALAGGGIVLLVAVVTLVVPVAEAESYAHDGDELVRAGHLDQAAGAYMHAFKDYADFNGDYASRAARAILYKPNPDLRTAKDLFDQAIAANPSVINDHLSRGQIEMQLGDGAAAQADFDTAVQLDPNDVSDRLQYAALLQHLGQHDAAMRQYDLAVKYNSELDPEEPKRLTPEQIKAAKPG